MALKLRQIVFDLETTGLSVKQGHRIIEIGCVELVDRQRTGGVFHRYINPERSVDVEAFAVHGLSDAFLSDKPVFSEVAQELVDYLWGAELIIHNAPFDMSFLRYQLAEQGVDYPEARVIDTLVLARRKYAGKKNSLDALCQRYGVNNQHRERHGALLDATLLAEVYLALTSGQMNLMQSEAISEDVSSARESSCALDPAWGALSAVMVPESDKLAHEAFLKAIKSLE